MFIVQKPHRAVPRLFKLPLEIVILISRKGFVKCGSERAEVLGYGQVVGKNWHG